MCYQNKVPWIIFLTISCSLFCCFHNFKSWKVCSWVPCLCLILSIFSVVTLVPGKLSASMFSQLGVRWLGTANLKKASSHRVTSETRKRKGICQLFWSLLPCLSLQKKNQTNKPKTKNQAARIRKKCLKSKVVFIMLSLSVLEFRLVWPTIIKTLLWPSP